MKVSICLSLLLISVQPNFMIANEDQNGGIYVEQTKSVSVSATSEANAILKAEDDHPGWKSVSVRKSNPNDDKSKTYIVKLKKS